MIRSGQESLVQQERLNIDLLDAIEEFDVHKVRKVLSEGADPNLYDRMEVYCALELFCRKAIVSQELDLEEFKEVFELFLQKGASLDAKRNPSILALYIIATTSLNKDTTLLKSLSTLIHSSMIRMRPKELDAYMRYLEIIESQPVIDIPELTLVILGISSYTSQFNVQEERNQEVNLLGSQKQAAIPILAEYEE